MISSSLDYAARKPFVGVGSILSQSQVERYSSLQLSTAQYGIKFISGLDELAGME